jgi:hypothetical protein
MHLGTFIQEFAPATALHKILVMHLQSNKGASSGLHQTTPDSILGLHLIRQRMVKLLDDGIVLSSRKTLFQALHIQWDILALDL